MARQAMAPLADRIKEAQEASGLANADLARAVGVHLRLLQKWRAGTVTPSMENLAKLSRVLDRPLSWFFEDVAA